MDIEALRNDFRPERVSILFAGESPPASGRFFYSRSQMTLYTRQAFEQAYDVRFNSIADFLAYFKSAGCFLDDLSHEPVDHLGRTERERILEQNVEAFSNRLRDNKPAMIVVFLKRIAGYVQDAASMAQLDAPVHVLPFPGFGHQKRYIEELAKLLRANPLD